MFFLGLGTALFSGLSAAGATGIAMAGAAATGVAGAVGAAVTTGGALATATAGAVAGSVVSVGGSMVGIATTAGGVVVSAGGATVATIGEAASAALTATSEMIAAAAAESTVMVGQIPVVGESLATASQTVGSYVGSATTKVASSMGVSSQTAGTLGTITGGTTTHEINKQVLNAYNDVKYEAVGLGELRKNYKVLDNIFHGKLDRQKLTDLVVEHKDEVINLVAEELEIDEINDLKEAVKLIQDIRKGEYSYEELCQISMEKLSNSPMKDLKEASELIERIRKGNITPDEAINIIVDSLDLPENNDIAKFQAFLKGELSKNELQYYVLDLLDAPSNKEIEENILILKNIAAGKLAAEDLKAFILENIEKPDFKELKNNVQLLTDIKTNKVSTEGLAAIVATSLGVKNILPGDKGDENKKSDCILNNWLGYGQSGLFYDIQIPKQKLRKKYVKAVKKFFPTILVEKDIYEDTYFIGLSIQNIGEPVVYSLVNFLLENEICFNITQALREIIITENGSDLHKIAELNDYKKLLESVGSLPYKLPSRFSVEKTVEVINCLKAADIKFEVKNSNLDPDISMEMFLVDSGKNTFEVLSLLKKYGFTTQKALKIVGNCPSSKQLIYTGRNFKDLSDKVSAFVNIGAHIIICHKDSDTKLYDNLIKIN